jgi:cytochrome c6
MNALTRLSTIALSIFLPIILPLLLLWNFLWVTPALADTPNSAVLFENTCAGCHINGGNIIRRGKNLKLKTLQKNGVDSEAAIAQIITHGKGIMSAYGERLSAEEIEALSRYVLEQAKADWKS